MSTEIPTNQKGDAVAWAEANMWVIVMVRFHTLLRCRKDLFMLYKDFKSTGENLYHPHPCVRCGMPDNQKGEWQKCCR